MQLLTLASALTAALSSRSWNWVSASKNLVKEAVKKSVVSGKEADSRYTCMRLNKVHDLWMIWLNRDYRSWFYEGKEVVPNSTVALVITLLNRDDATTFNSITHSNNIHHFYQYNVFISTAFIIFQFLPVVWYRVHTHPMQVRSVPMRLRVD